MRRKAAHSPVSVPASTRGFTLVEVLVALALTSVGLMGAAAMQVQGIRYMSQSFSRTSAVQLTYDLMDRMFANPTRLASGYYADATNFTNAADQGCVSTTANCSLDDIASQDLFEWKQAVANALPSGVGAVCIDSDPADTTACDGVGSTHTITVSWTEMTSAGAQTQSFSLRVKP